MKEKRKLKYPNKRKPKHRVGADMLAKEVSKRTGFRDNDVKAVFNCYIQVMMEHLANKSAILLPKIGMIYPFIKPPRIAMNLNGGAGDPVPMQMAARWVAKFRPGNQLAAKLLETHVTDEEIDNLYRD